MNNILSVLDSFTFELYLLYQNNLSPGTKILGLCYYIGKHIFCINVTFFVIL